MELTDEINNSKNIGFIRKSLIAGALFAAAIFTPGCLGEPTVKDIPYSDRKVQSTEIGYRGRKEHCEIRYWQSEKFPRVVGTDIEYLDGKTATFLGHTNPRSVDYTRPVKTTSSDNNSQSKTLKKPEPATKSLLCLDERSDGKHALPTRKYHRDWDGHRIGGLASFPYNPKTVETEAFFEPGPQPKY